MKILLKLMLVVTVGAVLARSGVGFDPQNIARMTGISLPAAGSGMMGTLMTSVLGHGQPRPASAAPTAPAAPPAGLAKGAEFVIPPELTRLANPGALLSAMTAAHDPAPAPRATPQQAANQARANPAAYQEQVNVVNRTPRGQ